MNDCVHLMHSGNSLGLISKDPFSLDFMRIQKHHKLSGFHFHDCYELCFIIEGDFYYFVKDRSYLVKQGDCVLVNAQEIHSTASYSDKEYARYLIDFKKEYWPQWDQFATFFSSAEYMNNGICIAELDDAQQQFVRNLFRTMYIEKQNFTQEADLFCKASLTQLLLLIGQNKISALTRATEYLDTQHRLVSKIVKHIHHHYAENLTLESVAEQFFISKYHFCRIFKKVTGFSFTEYCNNIRIREAQHLLVDTNLKISQISGMVGYKSDTHLGRIFKQIVGISPREYRKKHKL